VSRIEVGVKAKDCCAYILGKRWLPIIFLFATGSVGSAVRAQDINIRVISEMKGEP